MSVFLIEESKDLKQNLRRIIDFYEFRFNDKKGILIKPNIVFPVSEKSGQITRHKVTGHLIRVLREKYPNKKIIMAEGTAAGSNPEENFVVSRYTYLSKKLKVPLLDLNKVERVTVKWKYGTIRLPKLIFENAYINLPILKKSSVALISGAMKNQKGLLDPNMKKTFHKLNLHEPIAHLNKIIQPGLTIMDGYNFFKNNILFAGDNTFEIDVTASKLLECDEPAYIKISRDIAVGYDNFKVIGKDILHSRPAFTPSRKEYQKLLRIRLWSNPRTCSMCRFLVKDIRRFSKGNLKYAFIMSTKLARHALTGLELIYGSKPKTNVSYNRVVCIGDCTRKFAQENGYRHVPGCPPTKKQMMKYF